MRRSLVLTLALLICWDSSAVFAQVSDDPVENARIQIGPIGLTPSASVTDVGVDTNVFNEAVDPKKDFTATVTPNLSLWLRAGRSRLSLEGDLGFQYFHTYADQRSVQGGIRGRYELLWNRLQPFFAFDNSSSKQRAGFEIDARVRRGTESVSVGTDFRIASTITAGVSAVRARRSYDDGAVLFGIRLMEILNRREDALRARLAKQFTVLTSAVVEGTATLHRFPNSPTRDGDSVRVTAGFDLAPLALISGSVRVGGLKFDGIGGGAPSFTGFVMDADIAYTLLGRTRFVFSAERDLLFSFEPSYPYYLQTGGSLTITPRLSTHWDVQARIGGRLLSYRERVAAVAPVIDRRDRYSLYGVGVGYNLGRGVRVGVNVDREGRRSETGRGYHGYRAGSSVTYAR